MIYSSLPDCGNEGEEKISTSQNTVVITGATGAVGSKIAKECLAKELNLIVVVRDIDKAEKIFGLQNVDYIESDFEDLNSVESAAEKINSSYEIFAIVNSVGGGGSVKKILLENKLEKSFVINYLSLYLLNTLLCGHQVNKRLSKIFTITVPEKSTIDFENLQAEKKYSAIDRWRQTNVLKNTFMMALADKHRNTNVSVVLYNPGFIKHETVFRFPGFLKVPIGVMELLFAGDGSKGAKQLSRYMEDDEYKQYNGQLLSIDKTEKVPLHYLDKDIQKKLITETDRLIQLHHGQE